MKANKETKNSTHRLSTFERIEQLHPYKTFLFFTLVGSTLLFLSMAFFYMITISKGGISTEFQLPKSFTLSTVLILLSSFVISSAVNAFKSDNFKLLKISLTGTFILGTLFSISQIFGWMQMMQSGIFDQSNIGVSYLYVITGIHFIHLAGGLFYLASLNYTVYVKSNDVANSLMFLTDNFQLTKIQLFSIYWHFMDVIWLLLFFMFLFTT